MSFIRRIWHAFKSPVRLVGRDLEGNKFFEAPSPNNPDRPKRIVEYHNPDEVWKYIGGGKRLPIQWSAWLAHTRRHAPSIEELQTDAIRQQRLAVNVAMIEARDRAEEEEMRRIRQEDSQRALEAAAYRVGSQYLPYPPTPSSTEPSSAPPAQTPATSHSTDPQAPTFLTPATPRRQRNSGTKFRLPTLDYAEEQARLEVESKSAGTASSAAQLEHSPKSQSSDLRSEASTLPQMPSRPAAETESWTPKARKRG